MRIRTAAAASLALALALSRQVIGLSAGMRELNSMFLDEGFGTLDDATLDMWGGLIFAATGSTRDAGMTLPGNTWRT